MAPHAEVQPVTDTTSVVVVKDGTDSLFTIDDILSTRQESLPLSTVVAAFSSAHLYKSKKSINKPKAKFWDHRISAESRRRQASSLKGAMKYFKADTVSLCGGLPSPDYFPFHKLSADLPKAPHFSDAEMGTTAQTFSAGKHDTVTGEALYDLKIALNYGQSMGPGALLRFMTEHTEIVHNPPYSDWDICMSAGSTSALDISLRMFVEQGHYVITESYTFSSAIETVLPIGGKMLGINTDKEGLLPEHLEHVLTNWDEKARKAPRPFVIYTVPTGQNPTASTQSLQRRKDIYAIAERFDCIIIEDEPYYFLQMEPFISGVTHTVSQPFEPVPVKQFLSNLIPSYLSLDTSGRVLRLDSFSKVIAPGSRCGWVTGSSQLVERFLRHCEVSSQTPSGFSLITLYKLLEENWGHKGFLEWLMYIRAEYTRRRDIIVNACEKYLPREIASWDPPMAGMFHWIKLDLTKHPTYVAGQVTPETITEIEHAAFAAIAEKSVLVAKGSWFRAERGTDTELFIRFTFAAAAPDQMIEAVRKTGVAIRDEFGFGETTPEGGQNGHANGHAK